MKDTLVKTSIEKLHRAGGEKRERRLNNAYLPKTFHNDCRLSVLYIMQTHHPISLQAL